jgi:phospholipase/carboxylesterase
MSVLEHLERPAAGEPEGLWILHHGRGADAHDLLPLADLLDPERRLQVLLPRGPLELPGWPGRHWYVVPRVGFPDPDTFHAAYAALAAFHEAAWERTGLGPERTILGGFSMGAVMSYALGLGPDRPSPAGIMALAGFIPTVDGWDADLHSRASMDAFVYHGRHDAIMGVDFARDAVDELKAGGLLVEYHETDADHSIDPAIVAPAIDWLDRLVATFPP